MILISDGTGYVDDGREIFDDDLQEETKGIRVQLVNPHRCFDLSLLEVTLFAKCITLICILLSCINAKIYIYSNDMVDVFKFLSEVIFNVLARTICYLLAILAQFN